MRVRGVITRAWRGITRLEDREAYAALLERTCMSACRKARGNLGARVFHKARDGRAEFLVVTVWDSWKALQRFAGGTPERVILGAEDTEYLVEWEEVARHWDVASGEVKSSAPPPTRPSHHRAGEAR